MQGSYLASWRVFHIQAPIHLSVHPSIFPCTHLSVRALLHLSVHPSVYPGTHSSACAPTHLSRHPSICPGIHPSVQAPIHLFRHPSICACTHSSIYAFTFIRASIHLSRHPFIYLGTHLVFSECLTKCQVLFQALEFTTVDQSLPSRILFSLGETDSKQIIEVCQMVTRESIGVRRVVVCLGWEQLALV